jgi:hypothetical protein
MEDVRLCPCFFFNDFVIKILPYRCPDRRGLVNSVCQCLTNVRVGLGIVFATVEVPSSSCAYKASTQSGRQQALQTFKHIMQAQN